MFRVTFARFSSVYVIVSRALWNLTQILFLIYLSLVNVQRFKQLRIGEGIESLPQTLNLYPYISLQPLKLLKQQNS